MPRYLILNNGKAALGNNHLMVVEKLGESDLIMLTDLVNGYDTSIDYTQETQKVLALCDSIMGVQ